MGRRCARLTGSSPLAVYSSAGSTHKNRKRSEAEDFPKENCIIADIIVHLESIILRNFQHEDLPSAIMRVVGTRLMLDAKTIQSQILHLRNNSS